MADVFITSTLKSKWNLDFAPRLCAALEMRGISCHLPQRDTNQAGDAESKCRENLTALANAQILLGVLLNATINSGLEFGYAHGIGKPLVFLTDENHPVPVMAETMYSQVIKVKNMDDISIYIDNLCNCLKQLMS
jgi:nucleoside 2-deoxyribosyltransferase